MDALQFMNFMKFDQSNNDQIMDGCFELRHKVFNERLNWEVISHGEREVDVFDNQDTWYAALRNESHQVVGTWRALPTTGDYMLKDTFPEMARGEVIPNDEKIWEISRFAIDKTRRTVPVGRNTICLESKALIKSFYDFAHQHDIDQLVAVTSVAAERMMKRLNVKLRRLGDGKAVKIGSVLTTAVLIDIPEKSQNIIWPNRGQSQTWSVPQYYS